MQAGDLSSYCAYVLEMVELMGAKDVEVKFVGLHPAERLHEMLFK